MKDRLKQVARLFGVSDSARRLTKRSRLLRRLLDPSVSVPLCREEAEAPFFIVGSGRCGTTLLRRLLQANPQVHIPPENWALCGAIQAFEAHQGILTWRTAVDLVLGRHLASNERWFDEPPSDLQDRLMSVPSCDQSLAHLLNVVYRYHGEYRNAHFTRWGDKTPRNVNCMNELSRVYPRARFIHLLRDGVDVVHSWSKRRKHFGDMKGGARRWKNALINTRSFAQCAPSRLIEIRYEDMVRKPEAVLRNICRFIDLLYEDNMLLRTDHYDEMEEAQSVGHYEKVFEEISTDSIGKGRRNLSAEQKATLAPLIDDELMRYGYDPATS